MLHKESGEPACPIADRRFWLVAVVLVAAVAAAFFPVLGNGWVDWDDEKNFLNNFSYRGIGASQIKWAWTTFWLGVYQPLAWMLLELQYAVWQLDPRGYHFSSLVLHAATSVTLFLVTLTILYRTAPAQSETSAWVTYITAGLATLLFAVHPLRVEPVAWVSCQPYLPCAFFWLLAVIAYLRAFPAARPPQWRWLVVTFLLFVSALLSKAPAVTLSVVLLLIDWYPLKRFGAGPGQWFDRAARRVWLDKVPFFAVSAAFMVVAVAAKRHAPNLTAIDVQPNGFGMPQIAQASYGIWFYLAKTVWPTGVVAYYPVPQNANWWYAPVVLACIAGAVGVTAVLLLNARRWPAALVAWLAYVTIAAPNLGLITISRQIAADRYSYIAMMPLVVLLAGAMRAVWPLLRSRTSPVTTFAGSSAAAALSLVLVLLSREQSVTWRDSETLWRHNLKYNSVANGEVPSFLGVALAKAGEVEEATTYFLYAIRLFPRNAEAHNNLGTALAELGRYSEAVEQFKETIRIRPSYSEAHNNLGSIYAKQGNLENAVAEYAEALRLDPENVTAYRNLEIVMPQAGGVNHDVRRRALASLAGYVGPPP